MDGTSGDQKLVSDRRVTNLPSDLEFHLTFQDDYQLVGCMCEILPSLSWRVDPEIATKPPFRPIGSNLFPFCAHYGSSSLRSDKPAPAERSSLPA
jgi:hypothetical protein